MNDSVPADGTFTLEPGMKPGDVPQRVIDELRHTYRVAKDYAGAFSDALKAQAEKHQIAPAALRRYIAALEGDKLDEATKEANDFERLLARDGLTGATLTIKPGASGEGGFIEKVRNNIIAAGGVELPDGSIDMTPAMRKKRGRTKREAL